MMVTNLFPVLTGQTLTGCGNLGGRLQGAKDDGDCYNVLCKANTDRMWKFGWKTTGG